MKYVPLVQYRSPLFPPLLWSTYSSFSMDHHSSHPSSEVRTPRSVWITTLPTPPLKYVLLVQYRSPLFPPLLWSTYLSFSIDHHSSHPSSEVRTPRSVWITTLPTPPLKYVPLVQYGSPLFPPLLWSTYLSFSIDHHSSHPSSEVRTPRSVWITTLPILPLKYVLLVQYGSPLFPPLLWSTYSSFSMDHHSSHPSSEVRTSRSVWITTLPTPPLKYVPLVQYGSPLFPPLLWSTYSSFSMDHHSSHPSSEVSSSRSVWITTLPTPPMKYVPLVQYGSPLFPPLLWSTYLSFSMDHHSSHPSSEAHTSRSV